MVEREREGEGDLVFVIDKKKILALNCVLKAQGKTFVILSKVFKLKWDSFE